MVEGGPLVGIIANPASGKDIRRLVALGSSVDNNEKINIVRICPTATVSSSGPPRRSTTGWRRRRCR
jgi:hypothetical protein